MRRVPHRVWHVGVCPCVYTPCCVCARGNTQVVLGLTGTQLLATLENGVSMHPRLEGRFLQVSGVSFEFDPTRPAGGRITDGSVAVGGAPLGLSREYKVIANASH